MQGDGNQTLASDSVRAREWVWIEPPARIAARHGVGGQWAPAVCEILQPVLAELEATGSLCRPHFPPRRRAASQEPLPGEPGPASGIHGQHQLFPGAGDANIQQAQALADVIQAGTQAGVAFTVPVVFTRLLDGLNLGQRLSLRLDLVVDIPSFGDEWSSA